MLQYGWETESRKSKDYGDCQDSEGVFRGRPNRFALP